MVLRDFFSKSIDVLPQHRWRCMDVTYLVASSGGTILLHIAFYYSLPGTSEAPLVSRRLYPSCPILTRCIIFLIFQWCACCLCTNAMQSRCVAVGYALRLD